MLWYMHHTSGWSMVPFLFFVTVHVLTAYVLVNLFVAIVMEGFALDANVKLARQVDSFHRYVAMKKRQREASTRSRSSTVSKQNYRHEGHLDVGDLDVNDAACPSDKSLRLFQSSHPVRRCCIAVVTHPAYDAAMCAVVLYGKQSLAFYVLSRVRKDCDG